MRGLEGFEEIWAADFEYSAPAGHRPAPICLVATELRTGRHLRFWEDQLARMAAPPFRTDHRSLFVAYAAAAEFGCFHVLGWKAPARVLDLFFEFRALANGLQTPSGSGLLGAMVYHGLPVMEAAEKESMMAESRSGAGAGIVAESSRRSCSGMAGGVAPGCRRP